MGWDGMHVLLAYERWLPRVPAHADSDLSVARQSTASDSLWVALTCVHISSEAHPVWPAWLGRDHYMVVTPVTNMLPSMASLVRPMRPVHDCRQPHAHANTLGAL